MDQMFTTAEAARYTGYSTSTILRWCKLGYISGASNVSTGPGNGYRIRQSDLDEYLGRTVKKPVEKTVKIEKPKKNKAELNMESIKIAANNFCLAIELAQEELDKIQKALKDFEKALEDEG